MKSKNRVLSGILSCLTCLGSVGSAAKDKPAAPPVVKTTRKKGNGKNKRKNKNANKTVDISPGIDAGTARNKVIASGASTTTPGSGLSGRDIGFLAGGAIGGGTLLGTGVYLFSGKQTSQDEYHKLLEMIAGDVFHERIDFDKIFNLSLFFWLISDEVSNISFTYNYGKDNFSATCTIEIKKDAPCEIISELLKQDLIKKADDHYLVKVKALGYKLFEKPKYFGKFHFVVKLVGGKFYLTLNDEEFKGDNMPFLVAEGANDNVKKANFRSGVWKAVGTVLASALDCGKFVRQLGRIFSGQGGLRGWGDV